MIFSLIIIGLLIAVTIRQATQGFFSALITCVLSICCATAALGTYEWVAIHWVTPYLDPNYAMAVALAVIFGVPFTLLQVLFGKLVKRAGLLPALVEKVGGGICGFITAMVTVGIAALAIQMVPFDNGVILGFARVPPPDPENPKSVTDPDVQRNLFLSPDRFVVGLATVLSDGIFSGKQALHQHNPDLVEAVGWDGAVPAGISQYAKPGSIRVEATERIPFVYDMTPGNEKNQVATTYDPQQPDGGSEFWMIRVRLTNEARDKTSSHKFTLRQFRLVGQEQDDEAYRQFHPIAIQQADSSQAVNRHIRAVKIGGKLQSQLDKPFSPRDNGDKVEIVFNLPRGFRASFLEYKRGARAPVKLVDSGADGATTSATPRAPNSPAAPAPTVAANDTNKPAPAASSPPSSRRGRGSRRSSHEQNNDTTSSSPPSTRSNRSGGNIRTVTSQQGQSKFGDDLPFELTSYRQVDADLSGGVFRSGRISADPNAQSGGTDQKISKFFVPSDKRLLQLHVNRLNARSGLGRALSFATATLQNYFVTDTRGRRFKVTGKYAIAKVNGKELFEVQYFSGPVGSIGGLGKFEHIKEDQLKPTDQFVLLFLVDPGAHIKSFSTGGDATRQDDLTNDNLVAPD